ncbi:MULTISPECIES: hypothetical protein [unclassified Janthinobacterium]|uniref:hypothetical protein n=1 Tax=unclassified Janthinobacterium TaxID=2610881 RepID=UPI000C59569A|nr:MULTISPECIES: hypothetical protein [unclassified Janthinobacterium]MDN2674619.1 hypothetical protein [Janthinobacterium sp. SUN026]MED5617585.1 hypothetical protein [Janthinobacterium sp. P210005]PIF10944.1 hypothetical protein CLU94_2993 [Janthinobacterium sp. 13]
MKMLIAAALCCLPLLVQAEEKLPRDVVQFIDHAQMCEHFAGEWDDNDKARQREITQAVAAFCGQAQRQWKRLSAKYAGQPKLEKVIADNANDAVRSFRK